MTKDNYLAVEGLKLIAALAHFPLSAFVMQKLWEWHLTPVFAIEAPGIWRCLGLAMLIIHVTHQYSDEPKDKNRNCVHLVAVPLVILLIGWACK